MTPSDSPAYRIRRQLLAVGSRTKCEFYTILERFAAERFLYRLGKIAQKPALTLKGATLLPLWLGAEARATTGIDLQDTACRSAQAVRQAMVDACEVSGHEDALTWETHSIEQNRGMLHPGYPAESFRISAALGDARTLLRVWVIAGDVTPLPQVSTLPTLLPLPAPTLPVFSKELYLGEKLHMCMVAEDKPRMVDLHDMFLLIKHCELAGSPLVAGIRSTLTRQVSHLPDQDELPPFLSPAWIRSPMANANWLSYKRKTRIRGPNSLPELISALQMFFMAPLQAITHQRPFVTTWQDGLWS